MKQGIIPATEEDKKACAPYAVGSIFALDPLSSVPEYYCPELLSEWIGNQLEYNAFDDRCAGFAAALLSSLLEGIRQGYNWIWMNARLLAGIPVEGFGVGNRQMSDALRKIGTLDFVDEPFGPEVHRDIIADPTKWDINKLLLKSKKNIKDSSVQWIMPRDGHDSFDTFCRAITTLNKRYGKTHSVVIGIKYLYPSTATKIDDIQMDGTPHDVLAIGWDGDYAIIVNSLGPTAHDHGKFLLHRRVFNKWAEVYMAFTMTDATPEQVKYAIESGAKIGDPWHKNLIITFKTTLLDLKKTLLDMLLKKTTDNPGYPPVLLWDTPEHCRYSTRVMCDRAGWSWMRKVKFCACVFQESQWNPRAIGKPNKDGTRDYGLLQYNTGKNKQGVPYWIGPGAAFRDIDEVLNDPEKNVRIAIKTWDEGHEDWWASHSTGAYKQHLARESRPGVPY